MSGLTEEVKIATVRIGNNGGFNPGELFVEAGLMGKSCAHCAFGSSNI